MLDPIELTTFLGYTAEVFAAYGTALQGTESQVRHATATQGTLIHGTALQNAEASKCRSDTPT